MTKFSDLPGAEIALEFIALKAEWPGEIDEEYNKSWLATKEYHQKSNSWIEVEPHFVTRIDCSDTFFWGSADAERLTAENIHIFRDTMEELKPYFQKFSKEKDSSDVRSTPNWLKLESALTDLFCARVRKLRPQGACYKRYPEELWPLFDAAGPARETGLGNPYNPGENMKKD